MVFLAATPYGFIANAASTANEKPLYGWVSGRGGGEQKQ